MGWEVRREGRGGKEKGGEEKGRQEGGKFERYVINTNLR